MFIYLGDTTWTPVTKGVLINGDFADKPLQIKTQYKTGDDKQFLIRYIEIEANGGKKTMVILVNLSDMKVNLAQACYDEPTATTVSSGGIWTFGLTDTHLTVVFNGQQNFVYEYKGNGVNECTGYGLKPKAIKFLDTTEYTNENAPFYGKSDTASEEFRVLGKLQANFISKLKFLYCPANYSFKLGHQRFT